MSHKFRDITKKELNYLHKHNKGIIGPDLQYRICKKCMLLVCSNNVISGIHRKKIDCDYAEEVDCATFKKIMAEDIIREIIE